MNNPETVEFLGLRLANCTTDEFIDQVIERAGAKSRPFCIGYLNAATVNLACDQPEIKAIFKSLDCLYADGQSVVWAARFLGRPIPERINAGDCMDGFFERCAGAGLTIGLIGGRHGEAEGFAKYFRNRIAGLAIVIEEPGYFLPQRGSEIADGILRVDPDIVLLGMGSPRQEQYALEWSRVGRPSVWWCVGALFEYYSGTRHRAPVWMRRVGLEWAFRLMLEPARLWRRYLVGNPKFVARVLAARFRR